ncbi:FtsX-like permease family protein [Streptosporangium sp. NPDC000396]|uniref:FtsX-like permease family protein n=1 Tax=Streptosporangium sp. NPDC000396 TaxID=3366185 RepID=UPI003691F799
MSAVLAALRISRRNAWRAKGRSALIIAMVGLPVLLITALLTTMATVDVSSKESLVADLGTADALVRHAGRQPVDQEDYAAIGFSFTREGEKDARPWTTREVASAFPAGSRALQVDSTYEFYGSERYGYPGRGIAIEVVETDLRDPLTHGMFRMIEGRPPARPDEVAVSRLLIERGAKIGATIKVTRKNVVKKVVGVAEQASWKRDELIVALPGSDLMTEKPERNWLIDTPSSVTWADVKKLNDLGLAVASRAVVEEAPYDVDEPSSWNMSGPDDGSRPVMLAMITSMIVLEVVLLAGPAFAVGLRRRRTELGLVAAQGGGARHLRMIVLMDGVVLGALSAFLGAALGIQFARVVPFLVELFLDERLGGRPFEIPWAQVAAVAVLGAVSSVIAAVVPAAQAARMSVSAVLGGRAEAPRPRRGWPVVGAVLVVAGVALTIAGVWLDTLVITGGTLLTQLGFVALMPLLVGLFGRLSTRLPLPLRLASRDAARHRGRTAPAVAAVMGGVAVAVALAVPMNSAFAQERADYQPREAAGALAVIVRDLAPDEWRSVHEILRQELPGVAPVEMRGRDDSSDTFLRLVMEGCGDPCVITPEDFPVGDERVLRYVLGREDPAAEAALRAGKMVLLDPGAITGGQATIELITQKGETESKRTVEVPAVAAKPAVLRSVRAVLPPGLLERLGEKTTLGKLLIDPREHRVTDVEEERIKARLPEVTYHAATYLERGFTGGYDYALLAVLGGAAALLVLAAAFTATGLAAADARADLATLSAIGAPVRIRRLFVAGQAWFITASGAVLGVLSGAVPGLVSAWPARGLRGVSRLVEDNTVLDVPWSLLAVLLFGLPVLAALVAAMFTRTKVSLVRRAG